MCSLSGREWGHAQGERQCQEHKRGSKNIGINRVFTLFFHGYFSSNSPITPFGRRGELITSYRSQTTKVNSYMRSHNIQLAHFNKATFPLAGPRSDSTLAVQECPSYSAASRGVGRGCGLGRDRGVGVALGVAVGVGVALGVTLGVGVGVGVGVTGTIAYA